MPDAGHRWLLLVHQLPPRPSNLRVRIWRRLQQVGAVVLRNSLYVLPATDEAREDFNWVREEIMTSGGHVSVLEASVVDGHTDQELIEQFRRLSAAEYEDLATAIRAIGQGRKKHGASEVTRLLRGMRERFSAIQSRDYFAAPGRERVEQALSVAARATADATAAGAASPKRLRAKDYRGRTWVTRPRPGIDRFASAWLVRTFVDAGARFAFADSSRTLKKGHIPFDMPDVEFGHHGAHCTFETLMQRFGIDTPAVVQLSRVVHDLDLKESRYGMPECAAVARLVDGLRGRFDRDAELLEHGIVMIDALHQSFAADGASRSSTTHRARAPQFK